MNGATMNILIHVFCWYMWARAWPVLRSGISGLWGVRVFSLTEEWQIIFSSCTNYIPTNNRWDSLDPYLFQQLIKSSFLIFANQMVVKWYISVILSCIFLIYLLIIFVSHSAKFLFFQPLLLFFLTF